MNEKKIFIRSPVNCKLNTGLCQLCYGWNVGNGRMVEIGETVGILAAQSIGEPGTQLTMRTFHTGGIFSSEAEKNILSPTNGEIWYDTNNGIKKVLTKYKERVFLTLKQKKVKIYTESIKSYLIVFPPYTIIYTPPFKKICEKQIIGKVVSYNSKFAKNFKEIKEIKSSISGQVYIMNNLDFNNLKRVWILNGNIITYFQIYKNLRNNFLTKTPYTLMLGDQKCNKSIINNKKVMGINYLNIKNVIGKNKTKKTQHLKNYLAQMKIDNLKEIVFKKERTQQQIYVENNKGKTGTFLNKSQVISEKSKNIPNLYNSQVLQKYKGILTIRKSNPYKIPKASNLIIENYTPIRKNTSIAHIFYKKQKNEDIVQGLPKVEELLEVKKTANLEKISNNPHDKLQNTFKRMKTKFSTKIAVRKSTEKLQNYLINSVQKVYTSQGVKITRKHIEVITKQMTSKVLINKSNDDTHVLVGEIIELNKAENLALNRKDKKLQYEPIVLGISKVALTSQSFVAEACFQETIRILTRSAIQGKVDWLFGLKENVILGNLIPAGTGFRETLL